ncbi:MAG: flavodoxin family protein [candidate division WOR-3 bacterium]
MKLLAFSGSPRKQGKTVSLLSEVLAGASDLGVETELIHLVDTPVRQCMGCYSENADECDLSRCTRGELADGMAGLFQKIIWADAVVIGSPVYWYSVSGLTKTFLDRLTPLENKEKYLDGKPCGLVAVAEDEGSVAALAPLAVALSWMGFIIPPYAVVYDNTIGPDEALEDARRLGRNLAWLCDKLKGYNFYNGETMRPEE